MRRRGTSSGGRGGFTLIELLVVVAILVLLLAILIPGLKQVREHARRSVCATNLRGQGTALYAYQADWSGEMPLHFGNYGENGTGVTHVHYCWGVSYRWHLIDTYAGAQYRAWVCPEFVRNGVYPTDSGSFTWQSAAGLGGGYASYTAAYAQDLQRLITGDPRYSVCYKQRLPSDGGNWRKSNKLAHVPPDSLLKGESYIGPAGGWGWGPGRGWFGDQWHLNGPLDPAGGNILLTDGRVKWTTNLPLWYNAHYFALP